MNTAAQVSANSHTSWTPRRELGLASAIAAVAGETIAVGIFLTPAGMAKSLGSPFYLLLIWVVVGILTVCGALTFGELAARFPRDGGVYVFLEESYGRGTAFLYGWMCLLVLDPGLTAALAVGLASYFGYIVPATSIGAKFIAIGVIWLLCVLNMLSIRVSAGVLRWSTWLKLGLLAILIAWGFSLRAGSWSNFVPFIAQRPGSLSLLPALGAAMVGAFFSFGGWWDVSKISGEVRDPGRTLPRAMLFGTVVVTAVYMLVSAVFLYLVPLAGVTSNETFVAQAGSVLFGSLGGKIFAAIVVVCVFSSLAALIMSAPRVYYAMARDGLFFRRVSQISPRFDTPVSAVLIQGTVSSVLVAISSFQKIIDYFIFAAVLFLAMAGAGLLLARRRNAGGNPLFRTPLYPLPVVIFLLLILTLLILLALHSPVEAGLGGVVVLAGIPAYLLFRSNARLRDGNKDLARRHIPERA